MDRDEQGSLPERSWQMINHLLETGVILLGNGNVRQATNREIISAMLFAASKQPLKQRTVPLLDHLLEKTDDSEV